MKCIFTSLSSSEKAKWVVVDSFFTTSIPQIVLAAYSAAVEQGVKRRVTGRGLGTRAESCELSYGEEQCVPALAASFTIYLCVSFCLCVCYLPSCLPLSLCLLMLCGSTCLRCGEPLVPLVELCDRLTEVREAFNTCLFRLSGHT